MEKTAHFDEKCINNRFLIFLPWGNEFKSKGKVRIIGTGLTFKGKGEMMLSQNWGGTLLFQFDHYYLQIS